MAFVSSFDLLGIGIISDDTEVVAEELGAGNDTFAHLATNFTPVSAFAHLLFLLMYFPCLAVICAARKEMGGAYAAVMAIYATLLGWSVATLFYQIAEAHNMFYIIISILMLFGIYGWLYLLGKKEETTRPIAFAFPVAIG